MGSIEGDGSVPLSNVSLTVGRNNLSTTFSGVISDGTLGPGTLTKVGSGTLTLNGANTYTGGTSIERGRLLVHNPAGSGTGTGPVVVESGTLGGNGVIAGPVSIGTGGTQSASLAPGINGPGLLTITNTLTVGANGTYNWNLSTRANRADEVIAQSVTINSVALFAAFAQGHVPLPVGTVYDLINNTSVDPISGAFANLADGSTFTAGNNKFEVSYHGGDGNDLTLTVVP